MSELDRVEREYRALATRLIYESFERALDPDEQRQLNALSDQRIRLDAPNFTERFAPMI